MRVVIDSNMLESEELHELLSGSPRNRAVLTGYAWMEAYRYDAVHSICSRLSILKDFPAQVDVLKGARTIAGLRGAMPSLAGRMIRPNSTRDFSLTVEALEQARSGDAAVIDQIIRHGQSAEAQAGEMILGVPDILAAMPEMQEQMFNADEVRRIRTGAPYTPNMKASVFGAADQLTDSFFSILPRRRHPPLEPARFDTYLYRYALGTVIYVLAWIQRGSPSIKRYDRVHNDVVDISFATFGTFFNGLMSRDSRALTLYMNLRSALIARGGRVPSDWTELYGRA